MINRTVLRGTFAFVVTILLSASANAQVFRAYLASTGLDTNPCTRPAPCRLLPAALAAVADGGEIWMLDSANYNTATVVIAKSASILAVPGAVGSILAIGGPAVSIAADNLKVALHNLVIVPLAGGAGTDGVSMTGSSSLTIEDSLIANLPGQGVSVFGTGTAKITNATLRNNAGYAVQAWNGPNVSISGTKMLGNGIGGVYAYCTSATTTTAVVSDSIISGGSPAGIPNNSLGVWAFANSAGAILRISVTRSTIENTQYGLVATTSGAGVALVSVSNSMVTNNVYGWDQSGTGSVVESLGNNHLRGNNLVLGTLTTVSLQ